MAAAQYSEQPSWYQKCKGINAFFRYAIRQERHGKYEMFDAFLFATRASEGYIKPSVPTLFNEASPRAIVLASPHADWWELETHGNLISQWAAAASAVPYTEEVGQSVVDTLLYIVSIPSLRSRVPVGVWAWLEKRSSFPPEYSGLRKGTGGHAVRHVRALGDVKILKSYLLLVWSEWNYNDGLAEMQISIQEDFGGIRMGHHREDLINRLGHVLEQLDRGLGYFKQYMPSIDEGKIQRTKDQYRELEEVLLEVDREATKTLTRTPPRTIILLVR
jgi:hypothetical protein